MDKDTFWQLVETAKAAADDHYDRPEILKQTLTQLSAAEVKEFAEAYRDRLDEAYRWDLWAAAYIINGGCSDDGFAYFCDWLISEGKDAFGGAIENPETLESLPQLEDVELEEFRYVADEVYESQTGGPMKLRERPYVSEPAGRPWEEDEVQDVLPRLAKKYWG